LIAVSCHPRYRPRAPPTLTALGEQAQAYNDLSAACAEQGIKIPPVFSGQDR